MPIPKKVASRKAETVESVGELLKGSQAVILADYRGLTVVQINDIRKKLSVSESSFSVVKNTLFKRAADNAYAPDAARDAALNGPTAITFAMKDAVETSKAVLDYIATNRNTPLKVKGAIVGGKFYDAKGVDTLSKVPPKDQLVSAILGSINAPISGVVNAVDGVLSSLVFTLTSIVDQKQAGAAQ